MRRYLASSLSTGWDADEHGYAYTFIPASAIAMIGFRRGHILGIQAPGIETQDNEVVCSRLAHALAVCAAWMPDLRAFPGRASMPAIFCKTFVESWPSMEKELLPEAKMQELYKLLYNLKASNNVRAGYNAAVKSINKSTALLAVVAADTQPYAIVEPLPIICEQKGVDVVYVSSKAALGKACHLQVNVIACTICVERNEDSSRVQNQVNAVLR